MTLTPDRVKAVEAEFRAFRSNFLLLWMFSNIVLVQVILRSNFRDVYLIALLVFALFYTGGRAVLAAAYVFQQMWRQRQVVKARREAAASLNTAAYGLRMTDREWPRPDPFGRSATPRRNSGSESPSIVRSYASTGRPEASSSPLQAAINGNFGSFGTPLTGPRVPTDSSLPRFSGFHRGRSSVNRSSFRHSSSTAPALPDRPSQSASLDEVSTTSASTNGHVRQGPPLPRRPSQTGLISNPSLSSLPSSSATAMHVMSATATRITPASHQRPQSGFV